MRTGRTANDILAAFDRLVDPFAGTAQDAKAPKGAGEEKGETPASTDGAEGHAGTEKPQAKQIPGDGNKGLGFDQEDKSSLPQQPRTGEQKTSSSSPETAKKSPQPSTQERPKDSAREKNAPKDSRDQTLMSQAQQLGNKLQEGLQKGLAAFAKLASLGKNGEAEKEHAGASKESKKGGSIASERAALKGKAQGAEGPDGKGSNFASHTTEGAPTDGRQQMKAQEKAEAHIEHFREELRAIGERGADAKKTDKPREGKDAHAAAHAEGAAEMPELRELIGAWHPETCVAEEEEQKANALRIEDALGEQMRCRGMLEDGTRCIRKPVMGIPYCREHASAVYTGPGEAGFVTIGAGVPTSDAPPEVTEPEAVAYTDGAADVDAADATDATDATDAADAPSGAGAVVIDGDDGVSTTTESSELADATVPDAPAYGTVVTD